MNGPAVCLWAFVAAEFSFARAAASELMWAEYIPTAEKSVRQGTKAAWPPIASPALPPLAPTS